MKIEQIFTELGLLDKEPEVYLVLLKMPGAQPASIIANRASLNRTTTYKALIKLAKKGLVTKTQRQGVTCFFAEDPDKRLEDMVLKKQEKVNDLSKNILSIIPMIKDLRKHDLSIPTIRFYEGVEGVKRIYEDNLVEGKPIYAFENAKPMSAEVKDYVFNDYIPRRAENDIFVKVITPENKEHIKARKNDKKFLRETKFFSVDIIPIDIEINIYGAKTAIFSYKKEEMFAIIIESASITKSLKSIFDFCWQFAK